MAKVCSLCNKEYKGAACPVCTETGVDVKKVLESEKAQMEKNDSAPPTAFLVDLVSNRKIPITTPRCRVGRDDLNDIVISGDQSISRFHFIITYENGQYMTQDAKSRHGTFLNGNQIGGPEPINDGDVLKIGVSLFWFVIESAAGTEKEEPLPPVDVEKAPGAEEVSMKTGGDYNYSAEKELSATQEISIISPEALAQYSLTKKAEDEAFEPKEPTEEISAESTKDDEAKADSSDDKKAAEEAESKKDADDEKAESKKDDDLKPEPDKDKEEEPAKAEEKSEEKSEEKKDEEPPVAEETKSESKNSDEETKDEKEEDKSVQVDFEPTAEEDSESKKKDDIEIAVKDLLEPLQSEIEASREMVRDALRKGELKAEPEEEKQDSKEADEKKEEESPSSSDEEKSKDSEKEENKEEQPESTSNSEDEKPEETKKDNEKSAEAETLEKIAEIIDDSSRSNLSDKRDDGPSVSADRIETELASDHDKATNGLDEDMTTVSQMGPTNVPDWCKRYFSDELKHLNKELDTLNDQIKAYQDKIRKIEGQAALTKGIRNTLLTSEGDDLIEACKKVLALAGWKVTQSEEDKHEFLLEHEDEKVAIARVISLKGAAERSHLGQLTISQTRFWCEKGIEPKGVLIVGRVSDKSPKERGEDTNEEVIEYANMKNVCIMNTLQLLALYRDIALKDGKTGELRSSIHDSKGWLKGFDIEPGDDIVDEDGESSKSKSLSSLLSA